MPLNPTLRPVPDTATNKEHLSIVNEVLHRLESEKRMDKAQASYLLAFLGVFTRWTAPRVLIEYVAEITEDSQLVTRDNLELVRSIAEHYATCRDSRAAIDAAEVELGLREPTLHAT
jgi:hypothetical protein